jgi:OmcA/MtrC family decaheme c-type cytochrome
MGLILVFTFTLIGCGSESGGTEEELVEQEPDEQCIFCHGPGRSQDVAEVHSITTNSPSGVIDGVTIDGVSGKPTVSFRLFDGGSPIAFFASNNIRFTIAQLVTAAGGNSSFWQSYINDIETNDGTTEVQADYERASAAGGTFTDIEDGSYTYEFSFDITNVTDPVAVVYNASLTHRIAMQVSDNVDNAFLDFVPDSSPVTNTRDIAVNESCNECHIKLGLHGGDRIALEYCLTCHNPGSADANSGNTIDFKVMVHKIHYGENLPSVEAGGEYAIWGFENTKHDYSDVVYPQDIRNCTKCHDGADGYNWNEVPTMEACGSCHDDVNFGTGANHDGGAQADNSACANADCHERADIESAHAIPDQVAAALFEYNIIDVTNTAPGEFPVVTFSVTDLTNDPYDILNDDPWTGRGSLNVRIGWPTTDYTNTGSGSTPAQPISIDALAGAQDNLDGTFTVTSSISIPSDVTGSGVVFIDGHPAADFDGDGDFTDTLPVKNAFFNFPITDPEAVPRREVVDVDNCDQCHGYLSLHGANRNDEIQACVICHNANATDINRRPDDPDDTADGKVEETIDFKHMIHAIHGAQLREDGIVVFGFGDTEHDFSHVHLPNGSENLKNCEGCHVSGAFELPLDPNVQTTTISTGDDPADPNDDTDITPIASVCSSCHDSTVAKTHMAENGGNFDFLLFAPDTSDTDEQTQTDLCGPGLISAQPGGHTSRTDCCSCHAIQ